MGNNITYKHLYKPLLLSVLLLLPNAITAIHFALLHHHQCCVMEFGNGIHEQEENCPICEFQFSHNYLSVVTVNNNHPTFFSTTITIDFNHQIKIENNYYIGTRGPPTM